MENKIFFIDKYMENLILSILRVGYVVREISEEELDEILQIRLALESLSAKWAALKISAVIELVGKFHDIISKASRS